MSHLVSLRMPLASGLDIDDAARVIRGVSVITAGEAYPANADPFIVDMDTLCGVRDAINRSESGIKSRVTHPELQGADGFHEVVGKIRNARIVGNQCKADFHLASFADESMARRIFGLAKEQPEDAGLSIVIESGEFIEMNGQLFGRVHSLFAVDWVGTPAANPHGMLSKKQALARGVRMEIPNEQQMELLRSFVPDLPESPTVDELTAAVEGLDDTQQTAFHALADSLEVVEDIPMAVAVDDDDEEMLSAAPTDGVSASQSDTGKIALADAKKSGTQAERQRIKDIRELAMLSSIDSQLVFEHIDKGTSADAFRKLALQAKQAEREPVAVIKVGEDQNRVSLNEAIPQAIMLRAGRKVGNPHDRAGKLRGQTVVDMGRQWLAANGVRDAYELSRLKVVELMGPRAWRKNYPALAQSSDSFDNILVDTINKSLTSAYNDAAPTWQTWARRATNPDFKTITRAALSESPSLTSRVEGEPITYTTLSDKKETYTLTEYVSGLRLTRKAIVNDDLDSFNRIPQLHGNAAARKEDDVAYAIITANATMTETGRALFNTTEGNLTSSGTALSVTSLDVGFSAMFNFKGPKSAAFLELVPKFLLVPSAKKGLADQLINSVVDPAKSNSAVNPYANTLTVIPSARLNANSALSWYLLADHRDGQIDTVEVCFLEGEEQPVLKQESDFDTDDMKFAVRHTVGAKAIDWRGMYKNNGA